jgi:hypothetical protein
MSHHVLLFSFFRQTKESLRRTRSVRPSNTRQRCRPRPSLRAPRFVALNSLPCFLLLISRPRRKGHEANRNLGILRSICRLFLKTGFSLAILLSLVLRLLHRQLGLLLSVWDLHSPLIPVSLAPPVHKLAIGMRPRPGSLLLESFSLLAMRLPNQVL